ncbi:serine hydrolase [Rhizobium rhizogenes]|uniref:serine hydrolase domain-containing protein n=1 Tax=Rhizobium rhizogenes TaxID=359 RepID=UPI00193E983D|nr:serine hydrolase [Rhizobium rhizogenes]QRM38203.1 serine hydrolase [Rhizobium rhizogenes]
MRFIWLLFVGLLSTPALAQTVPSAEWTELSPQTSGWSAPKLAEAKAFADGHDVSAVMVVQHGAIVAEWGDTSKPMELASIRKSLLDSLIGIAVVHHQIDLGSALQQLGIDDNPPSLSDQEKQATVRMLLEARSGIYHPALYETEAMAARRPQRFSHVPGMFWYYNNWDFNALGTIYEKATGISIYDAFEDEIARKIGMQDYDPHAQHKVRGRASIHPAYTFRMSTRDLARFALLFLDGGRWNGQEIVPQQWVRDSTTPYSDADHEFGYGYLWWTADRPSPAIDGSTNAFRLPAGSYFAWGAGGQYAFVIPQEDLVIVERTDRDLPLKSPRLHQVADLIGLIRQAEPFKR